MSASLFISTDDLLEHWQGHRRLTRRFIDIYPEDRMATYAIGGMRPFSAYVLEFLGMGTPTLQGLATGNWDTSRRETPTTTRAELLRMWDEETVNINRLWQEVPPEAFQRTHVAFGQWKMAGHALVMYVIDNEIHHRAQASVYLRSLGIEPPFFPDRS